MCLTSTANQMKGGATHLLDMHCLEQDTALVLVISSSTSDDNAARYLKHPLYQGLASSFLAAHKEKTKQLAI